MSTAEVVCVHWTKAREEWHDDKTIKIVDCTRCHVTWKEGDPEPRVVVAKVEF